MRKRNHYGWQWTRTYARDGIERYTVARRPMWDLRCEESPCRRVHGRKTPRWRPKRRRWRAGSNRR